jgi:hypothetical protein
MTAQVACHLCHLWHLCAIYVPDSRRSSATGVRTTQILGIPPNPDERVYLNKPTARRFGSKWIIVPTIRSSKAASRATFPAFPASWGVLRCAPPRHVLGRWHILAVVPRADGQLDTLASRAGWGPDEGGTDRLKTWHDRDLRSHDLGAVHSPRQPSLDRFQARRSGTKGLEKLPLCATFWSRL